MMMWFSAKLEMICFLNLNSLNKFCKALLRSSLSWNLSRSAKIESYVLLKMLTLIGKSWMQLVRSQYGLLRTTYSMSLCSSDSLLGSTR